MSEAPKNPREQGRAKVAPGETSSPPPARIRIDVPLGTTFLAMQESIFRQTWILTGSQLRAAIALGIRPETISRCLCRSGRIKVASSQVPEPWPATTSPEPLLPETSSAPTSGDLKIKTLAPALRADAGPEPQLPRVKPNA